MEKEGKSLRAFKAPEPDFLLQWGNRKRLRCVKVRESGGGGAAGVSDAQKRTTSRVNRRVIKMDKDASSSSPSRHPPKPNPLHRESESGGSESRKWSSQPSSPEKEESRFYSTRGATMGAVAAMAEENRNGNGNGIGHGRGVSDMGGGGAGGVDEKGHTVLPRFYISLSSKEKEEDFMAMKGCKLPQRPKKRAKFIQKIILLVSPGSWLSDLSQERYEVREKKSSRKRKRGLKAMSMESDSE